MGPLAHVMRIADNEKNPAMGYIYAAMLEAKETIEKSLNFQTSKYIDVFKIIDKRWECQLHHPLHAAGYYLNPKYFYSKSEIENDPKLVRGLHKCIDTLCESYEVEDMVRSQLGVYKSAGGLFGIRGAIRQKATLAPGKFKFIYYDFSTTYVCIYSNENKFFIALQPSGGGCMDQRFRICNYWQLKCWV
jgi:hypothetical protein